MAFNVEFSASKKIREDQPISVEVDSVSHIVKGIASLHVDSLNGHKPQQSLVEPISFGYDTADYKDLNRLVNSKLEELQRVPLNFLDGRDRHIDVTPFAFNQVRIEKNKIGMNGSWISFPDNDPFVTNPLIPGKYIATSAPVPDSFPLFMQMLEQHAVPLVISLTNFIENYSLKAHPYLPYVEQTTLLHEAKTYEVTCIKVDSPIQLSDTWLLERRDFKLVLENSFSPHYFSQWHLPHWKDYSSGAVDALAKLVEFAYHYRKEHSILAPIVVHCSAGIGRAGTFINCSECYERWKEQKPVRIFDIAAQSRLQRLGLGGNREQYEILYKVFEKLTSS